MLNLGRLRLLHEFSVLGTVSAVAEAVHLTRQAVSQQLEQLENELDIPLFQREGRNLVLTPAGRTLVARSAELFRLANRLEAEMAAYRYQVAGEVRMAAFTSIMIGILPEIIHFLEQEYPGLFLRLREESSVDGLRLVATNQVDIAISHGMGEVGDLVEKVEVIPYCVDFLYLVLPARHRHAEAASIRLGDLGGEKWVFNLRSVGYHKGLTTAFATAGYEPDVFYNCYDMLSTLEFVRRNQAVTILPGLALRNLRNDPDFRFVPVDPFLTRKLFLAVPRGTTGRPAVRAVIQALTSRIPLDLMDWYLRPETTELGQV